MLTHVALLAPFFVPFVSSFCVTFNSADHCAGKDIGKFEESEGPGCKTKYKNISSSGDIIAGQGPSSNVVIWPQGPADAGKGVAFYGEGDCHTLIGFGNVQTYLGVGAFASFEVIDIKDSAKDLVYPLDPPAILSLQPNVTATQMPGETLSYPPFPAAAAATTALSNTSAKGSRKTPMPEKRSESPIEDIKMVKRVAHGAVHKSMVRTCMINSGADLNFSIKDVGAVVMDTIKKLNPNGQDWAFLDHPLVIAVVDTKGKEKGYVYLQTRQHSDVTTCTDQGSESDALIATFADGIDRASTVSDMRIDLKLLTGVGVTNTLYVSTRSNANADKRIHSICEAVTIFD